MAEGSEAPIITVKRRWSRPDPNLISRFSEAPTGNVSDAAGRKGSMAPSIKPVTHARKFCGPALTIDAGRHDNLAVWAAMESIEPGDVLVISTHGHNGCAVIGDLIVSFARNRGAIAAITDGMVRDMEGLAGLGFPVFAAGVRPSGPGKLGPGSVGLPVWVSSQRVCSGDLVVGDADGVVVVEQAELEAAAETLDQIIAKEAGMEAEAVAGKLSPSNIDAVLDGVLIQYTD